MTKRFTLFAFLLMVFALAVPGAHSQTTNDVSYTPYVGAMLSGTNNMGGTTPDVAIEGGVQAHFLKVLLTTQSLQFDSSNNLIAGGGTTLTYDGNLLFERGIGALAYGAGIRVTISNRDPYATTVTRPYLAVAHRGDGDLKLLEFILPGNDAWRDQFGLLASEDLEIGQHLSLALSAGLFNYHEGPATVLPVFESNGVTTYLVTDSPRKLGVTLGIGFKYWLK